MYIAATRNARIMRAIDAIFAFFFFSPWRKSDRIYVETERIMSAIVKMPKYWSGLLQSMTMSGAPVKPSPHRFL